MVTNTTEAVMTELVRTGEQRDRLGRKITPAARRRFVEAHLQPPVPVTHLEVRLPDGTVLRGGHAPDLAALVQALTA